MKKYIVALALACVISGSSFASNEGDKSDVQQKEERKGEAWRAGASTFIGAAILPFVTIPGMSPLAKSGLGAALGGGFSYLESRNSTKTVDRTSQNIGAALGLVCGLILTSVINK